MTIFFYCITSVIALSVCMEYVQFREKFNQATVISDWLKMGLQPNADLKLAMF